ncbi:MAG: tripartite tricarboxylate transporter substrate-binding protein [Alcaligenaceae bacterium]
MPQAAGGNLGTQTAAKAQPDGHTLLVTVSTHAINAAICRELPYDPIKSFAPIMLLAKVRVTRIKLQPEVKTYEASNVSPVCLSC